MPGRGFSGGIRVTIRMAEELNLMGHNVSVLYKESPQPVRSALSRLYKKFYLKAPGDWIAQTEIQSIPFKKLSAKLVGKRDFIIAAGPDHVEGIQKLPNKCGQKVFYAHGLTMRNSYLREKAWNAMIPKIAVSSYVRQEMLKAGVQNIVGVVSNGIDRTEYYPENSTSDRMAVGTVYGSVRAKDPDTILSVFSKLHNIRPNLPLLCFSDERRPKKMTSAVRYRRLPFVSEAREIYSKCAVWFCASRSEGFPGPVLEAMACGCALVCSDCGGINDYLISGVNGIIVEKESPDQIVNEIIKLLDSESRRIQLVEQALSTINKLTWKSAAASFEEILEKVISEYPAINC